MIQINTQRHIEIVLTHKEQRALLEHSAIIEGSILEKIQNARFGHLVLLPYELQLLRRDLNYEAEHAHTPKLQKIFKKLHERLSMDFPVSLTTDASPSTLPSTLRTLLDQGPFGSVDELNLALQDLMEAHNQRADPDMGNLSPTQVNRLIYSKWKGPDSAVRLNEDIPLCDLQDARFLLNARIFLETLANQQEDTATAKGNLNRKFTKLMFEKMYWRPGHKEDAIMYNKVLNEQDVWPLHIVRVICEMAGLVRRRKARFLVTDKARELLAEGRAGELYALLFRTFFRQFNLSYLDGLPECYGLQATVAYSLYKLKHVAASWQSPELLVEAILLPKVREQIQQSISAYVKLHWFIEARLIRPLDDLGLLECSYDDTLKPFISRPEKVRTTALFDRFMSFSLEK